MLVPCTIRVDYTAGKPPDTLQAVVNYVGPDGTVYHADEAMPVKAGQSLTVPGLGVEVQLGSQAQSGDTPKPGKSAAKKPAAPAA